MLIERPSVGYKHSSASQVCLGKFDMRHHLLPIKLNLVGYTVWKRSMEAQTGNVHIPSHPFPFWEGQRPYPNFGEVFYSEALNLIGRVDTRFVGSKNNGYDSEISVK